MIFKNNSAHCNGRCALLFLKKVFFGTSVVVSVVAGILGHKNTPPAIACKRRKMGDYPWS